MTNDKNVINQKEKNKAHAGDWRKKDPCEQKEEEEGDEAGFAKMMSGKYTSIDNQQVSGSVPVSTSTDSPSFP